MCNSLFNQWFKDTGFTQKTAAQQMGISESYLSEVLNGRKPVNDFFIGRFFRTYADQASPFFMPDAANVLHMAVQEAA